MMWPFLSMSCTHSMIYRRKKSCFGTTAPVMSISQEKWACTPKSIAVSRTLYRRCACTFQDKLGGELLPHERMIHAKRTINIARLPAYQTIQKRSESAGAHTTARTVQCEQSRLAALGF